MNDSSMREYAERFIKHKQAGGVAFVYGKYWINRYIKHHESQFAEIPFPTKESIYSFVDLLGEKDKTGVSYIKEFCAYLKIMGIDAFVYKTPLPRNIPEIPYIISATEGTAFFEKAHHYFRSNGCWKGKDIILPALYTTMWCCGMRTAECRKLRRENVSLSRRHIEILDSKGHKDRLVVLSEDLHEYLSDYDNKMELIRPNRQFFFPGGLDTSPASACLITQNFKECWYAAFPEFDRSIRIRLYDFRHHFVYANLNRWLDEGTDINSMIYYLMKVTGHSSMGELLYYFHLVPEIYQAIKNKAKDLDYVYPDNYIEEDQ